MCAMSKQLRDTIRYYPGYPDSPGRLPLPLICRSVTRFAGEAGACGNFVAKEYWHVEWVSEGALLMRTQDWEQRIPAGHAVLVPPGLKRCFAAADPVQGHGMSVLGPQVAPMMHAFGYAPPGIQQPGACPTNDFLQLEELIGAMTDRDVRAASATAYRILAKTFRRNEEDQTDDPLVAHALHLLDTTFANPVVNIAWIARKLGCHRCHLSHRFREHTGLSPAEYLMRRRLEKAMNTLRSSHESVADIAERCGFSSGDHLSHVFREKVGTTPTKFRKEG